MSEVFIVSVLKDGFPTHGTVVKSLDDLLEVIRFYHEEDKPDAIFIEMRPTLTPSKYKVFKAESSNKEEESRLRRLRRMFKLGERRT